MMELSSCLSVSASVQHTSGHQEPTTEEAQSSIVAAGSRKAARPLGRERLLRYVQDIIRRQRKPLHEIVRDHALPFLPVQSLLRFRAVSTSWNRHISSPFFAHTQSHSHRSPSGLLFTSHTPPHGHYLPFDPASGAVTDPFFGFLPEPVDVRASARGLVCCSTLGGPYRRTRYYVCNPATGRWTAIQDSAVYDHRAVALLFRPSPLNFSADFDLVCVVWSNKKIAFEVFSSRMGRWRLSEEVACGGERLHPGLAVSAGGVAYWGTAGGEALSYDPVADRCRMVRLPADMAHQVSPWRLAEVDERLYCCCCVPHTTTAGEKRTTAADVYVLEEEESGTWRKIRRLEVEGVEVRPLISEGGDDEVLLFVDGRVVGFSLASGRGRLLLDSLPSDATGQCLPTLTYASSLVPLN